MMMMMVWSYVGSKREEKEKGNIKVRKAGGDSGIVNPFYPFECLMFSPLPVAYPFLFFALPSPASSPIQHGALAGEEGQGID